MVRDYLLIRTRTFIPAGGNMVKNMVKGLMYLMILT